MLTITQLNRLISNLEEMTLILDDLNTMRIPNRERTRRCENNTNALLERLYKTKEKAESTSTASLFKRVRRPWRRA